MKFLYYSIVLMMFTSCQNDQTLVGERINLYGGSSRTSSYEQFGNFIASASNNEKINSSDSSGSMIPPLAISSYQTVIATVEGSIHQFTSAMVEWSAKLDDGAYVVAGMCLDDKHNVYAIASDGCIYSISTEGKRRFRTQVAPKESATFNDILASTDGIIISSTSGLISKISIDGNIVWQYKTTLSPLGAPSSDPRNNIYISLTHNDYTANDSLLCLSPSGKIQWEIGFPTTRILTAPIVGKDNILVGVVISGDIPIVHSIDFDGKLIWNKTLRATPRAISIASDGSIITVSYNSGIGISQSVIEQFTSKGISEWNINFDSKITSPALIGKENIALIGVKSSAIGVYLLQRNGVLDSFLSLDTAPSLILKPTVAPGMSIIFAVAEKGYITRVGAKRGLLPI
ncbi:MAG: PQQ-like beta-propeller repeat protein [Bacteroidetes bacterium]|nr:PQQ-like beta-propeller repeat protein [Bacteroidota bacterium]